MSSSQELKKEVGIYLVVAVLLIVILGFIGFVIALCILFGWLIIREVKKEYLCEQFRKAGFNYLPSGLLSCDLCKNYEDHIEKIMKSYEKVWLTILKEGWTIFKHIKYSKKPDLPTLSVGEAMANVEKFARLYRSLTGALVILGAREKDIWNAVALHISQNNNIDKDVYTLLYKIIKPRPTAYV